jgi:parvulin-like peptidyl-prolyl isomerase
MQANNLLFANEDVAVKTEVSAAITEASAVVSTTAVAETVESTEVVVDEAAVIEEALKAANEKVAEAVANAEVVVEEALEASKEKVAEAVANAEAVVKEATEAATKEVATASAEKDTATEEIATIVEEAEVTTEAVVEEKAEATADEGTPPVAVTETESEESTVAVVEKENDVIATINGEEISREDLDRRLNVFRRMNQDVTDAIKMQVVDQLTKKVLLKQFVNKKDISISNEEINTELEKIKFFLQNNPSNKGKPLEEILETQGTSLSELKEEIIRALALSKYLETAVTDADKKSYFDANKDAFNGARVKASHVLIDTRNMKTDAEKEEAKKKIDIVKAELNNGADFEEMAKKYSNCPSAEKGGDIGFFQRKGSIVEEFAIVAFAMEVGEISEPVKTQFGYHIIKVTEKEEGKEVSYQDVSDMVDFVYMQIRN